jgi:hypothetical protein
MSIEQQNEPQLSTRKPVSDAKLEGVNTTSAAYHGKVLKARAQDLNEKERLSAYFTIAAAAFGLVSDGCELPSILFAQVRPRN